MLFNALATLLSNTFNVDHMLATTLISVIMGSITLDNITWHVWAILGVFYVGYTQRTKFQNRFKHCFKSKNQTLKMFAVDRMEEISIYLEREKTITQRSNIECSNPSYTGMNHIHCFMNLEPGQSVSYVDEQAKMYGTFGVNTLEYQKLGGRGGSESKMETKTSVYFWFSFEPRSSMSAKAYMKYIIDKNQEHSRKSHNIVLFGMQLLPKKPTHNDITWPHTTTIIYNDLKSHKTQRIAMSIGSYFGSAIDDLWPVMLKVHNSSEKYHHNGQTAYCNTLLYGPPGTGKSTFAGRVAKALGRHLVYLDLRDFIDDKTSLIRTLVDMGPHRCSNIVYLLDEFDDMLELLYKRENEVKPLRVSTTTRDTPSFTSEIVDSNTLTISDLKNIIQGSIPREGSIMFATTNNLAKVIKLGGEALVRHGRLTPYCVNYMEWPWFEKLVQHYFKQDTTLSPHTITCPTSEIIALADKFQDVPQGQEKFEKIMSEKLVFQSSHSNH